MFKGQTGATLQIKMFIENTKAPHLEGLLLFWFFLVNSANVFIRHYEENSST